MLIDNLILPMAKPRGTIKRFWEKWKCRNREKIRASGKDRHCELPGLAFGEPDDRLLRGIQYAAAYRLIASVSENAGSPAFSQVATDSIFKTAHHWPTQLR